MMIPEMMNLSLQAIMARLKVQEEKTALLEEKVARLEGNAPANGTRGSMTVSDEDHGHEGDTPYGSYVTPKTEDGSKVRNSPTTIPKDNIMYVLPFGGYRKVVGGIQDYNDPAHRWYILDDDGYVRMDVVNLEWFKDGPPQPTPTINALWPAPTRYTLITNRHGHNGHKGIDLATGNQRPLVYSGLAKGTVVQTFTCPKCDPNGTPGQRSISNAYGYGEHVIVRYDAADTPLLGDGYVFVMFAHLSALYVVPGQVLEPEQAIGNVGSTGDSTGNHLHIEPRRSTNPAAKWGTMEHSTFDPVLIYVFGS